MYKKMNDQANEIEKSRLHNLKTYLNNKHMTPKNGLTLRLTKSTVTNTKIVPTKNGEAMILFLFNNGEVWAPEHLKTKIMNSDTYSHPPFYFRPLGLRQPHKQVSLI